MKRISEKYYSFFEVADIIDKAIDLCSESLEYHEDLDQQTAEDLRSRISELRNIRATITIVALKYGYTSIFFKLTTRIVKSTDKFEITDITGKTRFNSDYWRKRVYVDENDAGLSAIVYLIL